MASNGRRKPPPNGSTSALTPRSQSLPQLQALSSQSSSSVVVPASHSTGSGIAAKKCRGEFCRVVPSTLVGLYGAAPENNEDPTDEIDDDLNASRRRALSRERDVALPDNGQRFKIGNNNLLLAKAEMAFLVANSKGKPDDAALQWQEADNVHRMELGRSNPSAFYKQVSVCRNCHRIYADLATFREAGFRWGAKLKAAWSDSKEKVNSGKKIKKKAPVSEAEAGFGSPEEDASLEYDRMFLAELAKHSQGEDGPPWQHSSESSARSEKEAKDVAGRHVSLSAVPAALPMLEKTPPSSGTQAQRKKIEACASKSEDAKMTNQHNVTTNNSKMVTEHTTVMLEKLVVQLREELAREQTSVKRVESQKQLLEQRLAQTQVLIQEREDEFRKKLLDLELDSTGRRLQGNSAGSSASATTDVSEIIETIDSLNRQLHQTNSDSEKTRRELLQHHQQEVKRLHEKYQLEMETLRLSEYTAKEQAEAAHMQMTQYQNEAQVAMSQARSARAALDDITKNKLPTLEEKNRQLERQLAESKAKSVVNSSNASSSAGPSLQEISAVGKHLNNKIEYLKAQLASEMKCKEELGAHLAGITSSMEAMKKEKRIALSEQEEAHKRHLERCESNFAQEKEVLCTQLASLQGKIAMLQANVTDLVQEVTMWKSKDANNKLAIDKMAEESVRLTRQIVDLESQVDALQDERKRDGSMGVKNANEETQRMQMEALLRRLDNERQYMKNQVDNETDLRGRSQQQVAALQEELRASKSTMDELTKVAEHKISALSVENASLERQLRDEKTALEESKLMLTRQLKDMQVKFLQTREQALLDKDELEKARIEVGEARSQLLAAREDVAKEKEYGKSANERMSKALTTIKASLRATEEEKNKHICRLEDESAQYMQKLAKTQGELLVLETKWSEDKHAFRRQLGLLRLSCTLNSKLEVRHLTAKLSAFWRLYLNSSVESCRRNLAEYQRTRIEEQEDEMHRKFINKCDELTQTLHSESVEALKQADATREREKEELRQFFEQERSQLEEDLHHIHARQMHELEEQYEHTIKAVDEQSAAALGALQRQCEELQQERDEARRAFDETRMNCEQLGARVEAKEHSTLAELCQREELWRQEKESIMLTHAKEVIDLHKIFDARINEIIATQDVEIARECERLKKEHLNEITKVHEDLDTKMKESIDSLKDLHSTQIRDIEMRRASELDEEKKRLSESWQRVLDEERSTHEKNMKAALERVEAKTQLHLESMQKDMNDRKANAVLQCTAKWQKATQDLQERMEVEKKVAYESGLQDRENEWQQAALQIKQKQKEELESMQSEAVRAIQAAEERHKMLLQAQIAAMRTEFEGKKQLELEVLRRETVSKEKLQSQGELDAALQQQEDNLLARFESDMQKLRDELADDHAADVNQIHERYKSEREELVRLYERQKEDLAAQLEETHAAKLEQLRASKDAELASRLEAQEHELVEQFEDQRLEMQREFSVEVDLKLKGQEERLLAEQEEAINQVQEDSEKLIEQVEVAMTELKKQKDALESELTRLRGALEEAEDAHFDVEENLKKQQKCMVFQLMALIMSAKKTLDNTSHRHTQQIMELQDKHDKLEAEVQRDKRQWERDAVQLREAWGQIQSRHGEMHHTLTSYKRDELVAHRSASTILSNEVSIVSKQMEEVSDMKNALEKDIEQLQAEAHGVEASLRQLMLQNSSSSSSLSSAGDGSLNMATVAKKRRLNEEFDALLEQVERKRVELRNMDKTLASLRQRREEKEAELKSMERKLVEILVGQQKQLLALLSATRELPLPPPLAPVAAS